MFEPDQYELVDFGKGWKTENFGGVSVTRETPSVLQETHPRLECRSQSYSQLRYRLLDSGSIWQGDASSDWRIRHKAKVFSLKPTPAGQLGIFPEQSSNWAWLEALSPSLNDLKALNLFAYTGGTTMALASQGASVVHVDSAQNMISWAKKNAQLSGLLSSPIRWICEDAQKFVRREINRGSRYDILVADPPSYGRGPKNEVWKFSKDIESLVYGLSQIADKKIRVLIISCHSTGFTQNQLADLVDRYFELSCGKVTTHSLTLKTRQGRRLECGICLRYQRKS